MKIKVKIRPNSKENVVEKIEDNSLDYSYLYFIKVKASPIDNKANLELINVLSKYFDLPKSKINLVKGLKSKIKTLVIDK